MVELRAVIEAILFVAEEPVPAREIAEVAEVGVDGVEAGLRALQSELEGRDGGLTLREVGSGWRLYTHPDVRAHLERFAQTERATRLSKAAMETLAVVAYKQPISRGQVGEIRGVDSEQALRTLERRGLVEEIGRAPGPGQAHLYGTTELFLEKLGLARLDQLPPLADHVPPSEVVDTLEEPFRMEQSPSSGSTS